MIGRRHSIVFLTALAGVLVAAAPVGAATPRHRMGTVAAAYPRRAGLAELNDVACLDRSRCLAVGEARVGGEYRTLFERWAGSRWQVMPSPTPSNALLSVRSISCSSKTACLAVGYYELRNTNHFNALVERWNGRRWRMLPAPEFGIPGSHQFFAVSCPAARFCVAVGANFSRTRKGRDYAVTAVWNGTIWRQVHRVSGGTMEGVSCPSARSCVAIFRPGRGNHLHRLQLAEGRWSAHVDNLVGVQSALTFRDMDCVTASSCTAVGYDYQEKAEDAAAAYHWDGRTWRTLHPGPRMRLHSRDLYGVSCPAASECIAVGSTGRTSTRFPSGQNVPLVERFHAGETQMVPASTVTDSYATTLNGVACLPGGLCRGVGWHEVDHGNTTHTFADQGVLF